MKKLKTRISLLLIITGLFFNTSFVQAATVTWTQTDWSGGGGQAAWSDATMYDSVSGDGIKNNLVAGQASLDQSAGVVVGQPDMISNSGNQGGTITANTLLSPGNAYYDGTKFFVADTDNNRVLIYNSMPTSSNTAADVVVGQPDMMSNSAGTSATELNKPTDAFSDGTRLYIADYRNSRVLIYNSIPVTDNAAADVVIGQPNMTSGTANQGGAVAANTLRNPFAVYSDGTKLFIVDEENSRVLIYNTIPVTDNASADVVIGQVDKDHASYSAPTANSLQYPESVYFDGTKLYIADSANYRIMIYNTVPAADNASADVVVGQPDMTSGNSGPTAEALSYPYGVTTDGTKLYIGDEHRILIYNSIPVTNGASADMVIGQADFTHNSTNRGGTVAGNTLNWLAGLRYGGGKLYVADQNNNRVLIYTGTHTSTLTSSVYDAGSSYVWGPLTYTGIVPANTSISFEVSTDGGSTWQTVTDYTTQTFGSSQTVAYRATLSNTDGISTPILDDVSIAGNIPPRHISSGSSVASLSIPVQPVVTTLCNSGEKFSPTTGLPCTSFTQTTPTSTTCTITQTLKLGSKGDEVKCLQTKLNDNLTLDGLFGNLTKAAVVKFQLANKLIGDGIVGPLTRGVLNK